MRPLLDMEVIQIEVTNACVRECSNCTRLVGHAAKPFFMTIDAFKSAVDSLVDYPRMVGMMGREYTLRNKLTEYNVLDRYDFIIIDTSPSLSLLNQNAFLASDEVLIPVNMEPLAVVGASSIIETIKIVRKMLKHKIALLGVVPTFVTRASNVAKAVLDLINKNYDSVLPQIRQSVKIKEASGTFQTVNELDPKTPVVDDLVMLVDRVMQGRIDTEVKK